MSTASSSSPRRRAGSGGFRRRSALHAHSLHFGPNMTPMVDVVMVILIFFMASAAFLGNEWFLRAAIPFEAGRGKSTTKPNDPLALPPVRLEILMDVDGAGNTVVSFVKLQRVSMDQFLERVREMASEPQTAQFEVLIKPTGRVPYRDVVRAHAACDQAGMVKVGYGITRSGAPATSAPAPSQP